MAVESEQAVGGVGECCFDVWCSSVVDMLRIFVPYGVADVVAFVLDPPLVSDIVVQVNSCGVPGGEAGDDECVFLSGLLAVEVVGSSPDAGRLLRMWKIDTISVGDPCFPGIDAASFRSRTVWSGAFLTSGTVVFTTASRRVGWFPLVVMM